MVLARETGVSHDAADQPEQWRQVVRANMAAWVDGDAVAAGSYRELAPI